MFQGEHSAILLTFIKLQFVIKIFALSIFECPFYTGFTVICLHHFYSKIIPYSVKRNILTLYYFEAGLSVTSKEALS